MQTVDVVDVEIGYDDVGGGAEVVGEDVDAAAHGGSRPVIGDLQVPHFDVLDVAEQHGICRDPAGFDLGNSAGTVTVDGDRSAGAAGTAEFERFLPY